MFGGDYDKYEAAVASGRIAGMVDKLPGNGVTNTYFDSRFLPTLTPLPGDLIAMGAGEDEHIAIYGGKNAAGREFMYHSGPAYPKETPVFASGPRANYRDENDMYYKDIILDRTYLGRWKTNYTTEFLRWLDY